MDRASEKERMETDRKANPNVQKRSDGTPLSREISLVAFGHTASKCTLGSDLSLGDVGPYHIIAPIV